MKKALWVPDRFDLIHGVPDRLLRAAHRVHSGEDRPRETACLAPLVPSPLLSLADLDLEAQFIVGGRAHTGAWEVRPLELDHPALVRVQLDQGARVPPPVGNLDREIKGTQGAQGQSAGREAPNVDAPHDSYPGRRIQNLLAPAPSELVPITPCGKLGAHGLSDADERQALRVTGKADVVGGHAYAGVPKDPLTHLHRFPAFFERGQIPALALGADNPQPAARGVKGEAAPDREGFDDLVGSEGPAAEHAGFVHGFSSYSAEDERAMP